MDACYINLYIVSISKVSWKDFVSDCIYRAKPIQYKQDELTRFEEGLDKHDDYTDKSYDYLNRDYGIVNSITCKSK